MDSLGYEYGDSRNGDHGGGINKMGDTSSPGEGRIFNDEKLISKATTIVSLTHDSKHMVWNGKKNSNGHMVLSQKIAAVPFCLSLS